MRNDCLSNAETTRIHSHTRNKNKKQNKIKWKIILWHFERTKACGKCKRSTLRIIVIIITPKEIRLNESEVRRWRQKKHNTTPHRSLSRIITFQREYRSSRDSRERGELHKTKGNRTDDWGKAIDGRGRIEHAKRRIYSHWQHFVLKSRSNARNVRIVGKKRMTDTMHIS